MAMIGAVQDLFDLHNRLCPHGPYRLSLFADREMITDEWPVALREHAPRLDTLIRGVSCLLANDLSTAALPLTISLWETVQEMERVIAGSAWRRPEYYQFLSEDLHCNIVGTQADAYRLFGEVLAIYLDILCELRPAWKQEYQPLISRLRGELVQTGDISSASATEESVSPDVAPSDDST